MRKKVKQFTVKRSKWGRNYLLNTNNSKMCCLGFLAKACGYDDVDIENLSVPNELFEWRESYLSRDLQGVIAGINDAHLKLSTKELKLKEKFKEAGIKIKFVD